MPERRARRRRRQRRRDLALQREQERIDPDKFGRVAGPGLMLIPASIAAVCLALYEWNSFVAVLLAVVVVFLVIFRIRRRHAA